MPHRLVIAPGQLDIVTYNSKQPPNGVLLAAASEEYSL